MNHTQLSAALAEAKGEAERLYRDEALAGALGALSFLAHRVRKHLYGEPAYDPSMFLRQSGFFEYGDDCYESIDAPVDRYGLPRRLGPTWTGD